MQMNRRISFAIKRMPLHIFKPRKPIKFKRITYMSRANLKFEPNTFDNCLKNAFYRFADGTKINGLSYLRKNTTSNYHRWAKDLWNRIWKIMVFFSNSLFWITILLLMITFAGVMIYLLDSEFVQHPTIITRSTPIFSSAIPFPAISICLSNPIFPLKAVKFIETL